MRIHNSPIMPLVSIDSICSALKHYLVQLIKLPFILHSDRNTAERRGKQQHKTEDNRETGLNMKGVWTEVPTERLGKSLGLRFLIPSPAIIILFLLLDLDNAPFTFYLALHSSALRSGC